MTEFIDEDAVRLLELDAWNRFVSARTRTEAGRALAAGARPAATVDLARTLLAETREAVLLAERDATPQLRVAEDGLGLLRHSREQGTPLLARELSVLFRFLRQARDLRTELAALDDESALRSLGREIPDVAILVRDLELAIDERGLLLDSATSRLRGLRLDLAEKKESVRREIERIAKRPDVRTLLRSTHPTIRDGRFVLAVRMGSRGQVKGIYHDRSASGETAFVEPEGVVDEQRELRDLVQDEEREVGRILWEFTKRLLDLEDELVCVVAVLARFDATCARAAAAIELGLTEPTFVDASAPLEVDDVRHPLLLAMARERLGEEAGTDRLHAAVTPFSLRLGESFDLLVVTGPNTGGKTVTLKGVGLIALLPRIGSFVPAATGARVPWFTGIFADVGDEQDLTQSLSTFSAHIRRIATVLTSAHCGALVLLDELGSGTDPLEGEALSTALLEHLLERGLRGVVTTHLGRLKEFAGQNARAANASMQFDPATLRPTYRLLLGIPGASNALKIARGLGLPADVLVRAEALLADAGDDDGSRALLDELDRSRATVEGLREEAARDRREAGELLAAATAESERVEREKAALERQAERAAEERIRGFAAEIEGPRRQLLSLGGRAASVAGELVDAIRRTLAASPLAEERRRFVRALAAGDRVHLPRYNEVCRVERVHRKDEKLIVTYRSMSMTVGFDEVAPVDPHLFPPTGST